MNHPLEEDFVDSYYSGVTPEMRDHLASCLECTAMYRTICETLASAVARPVPHRDEAYPARVWAQLEGSLPRRHSNLGRWLGVAAMAATIPLAFVAGMWTQRLQNVPILLPVNPKITLNIPPVLQPRAEPVHAHRHKPAKVPAVVMTKVQVVPFVAPQVQAVRVMQEMGSTSTRTLLATVTEDRPPAFRVSAIHTLAAQGDSGIIFSAIYRTDRNDTVRQAALDALAAQHDNAALLELARHETDLRSRAEIMRRMAK